MSKQTKTHPYFHVGQNRVLIQGFESHLSTMRAHEQHLPVPTFQVFMNLLARWVKILYNALTFVSRIKVFNELL